MQGCGLGIAEHYLVLPLAAEGAGHVEEAVADGFQLPYLTEHGADLGLGIVGQMGLTYLSEVTAYAVFHAVAHVLILLNALEDLGEVIVRRLVKVSQKVEHLEHALAENHNLLLCLEDGKFRGLHDTAADELQAELVLLLRLLWLDEQADKFLYLRNEPDEDAGVYDVESGMEGGQCKGELRGGLGIGIGIHSNDAADHLHKGEEHSQHPQDAEYVEHQVGKCRPARLRICAHGRQVCGKRGADILTHHKGYTLEDCNCTGRAQNHGYGHEGGRTLNHCSQDCSNKKEQQDGTVVCTETGKEIHHSRLAGKVHLDACLLEHAKGEQQERKAEEEVSQVAVLSQLDKDYTYKESRPNHHGNVEGESRRHDPGAHCGAYVGAHDHRYSLRQRKQRCVHERHRHHRCCCR